MTLRRPVHCFVAIVFLGLGRAAGQDGDGEKLVRGMEKKLGEA